MNLLWLLLLFSFERQIVLMTNGVARGPLVTDPIITVTKDVASAYRALLGRVSCLTSYQTVASIRKQVIQKRADNGPFGEAVAGAFHSFSMDNFNVGYLTL